MTIEVFRRKFYKIFTIQFLTVTIGLTLSSAAIRLGRPDLQIGALIALFITQVAFAIYISRNGLFYQRLKGIYPTGLPSRRKLKWLFSSLWLCPVTAISYIIFLLFKKNPATGHPPLSPPWIFRNPIWTGSSLVAFFLLTLVFQFHRQVSVTTGYTFENISYWTAPASIHYVTSVSQEVRFLLSEKKTRASNATNPNLLDTLQTFKKRQNLTSTGLIVATALVMMDDLRPLANRNIASEDRVEAHVKFFEDLVALTQMMDELPPLFLSFNPVSLYSAFGTVDATLTSIIDCLLTFKFKSTWVKALHRAMSKIEEAPTKDPGRIKALQSRLEKTLTYQTYDHTGSYWFGQLLSN